MVVFKLIWPATILAFILMAGLIVLLVQVWRERSADRAIAANFRAVFWILSGLNGVAALTWMATFVELLPLRVRLPVTDYGAPLGGAVLLLLVPLGFGLRYILGKRNPPAEYPASVRWYARLSTVFLLLSLFPGLSLLLFYGLHMASDR